MWSSSVIYLYVKTHNKTGLKYLGKTNSKDPHEYQGSGIHWCRHIKKHGYDVSTQILLATESKEELKETGIFFSKLFNVVESNEWANLMTENGGGFDSEIAIKIANKRVKDGTNPFCGGNLQRKTNKKRINDGTHLFVNSSFQKEMNKRAGGRGGKQAIKNGTHNFLGGDIQIRLVESGKHHLLNSVSCVDKSGVTKRISKETYFSQEGSKENWEYVHFNTKEAKRRKIVSFK